MRRFRIAFVLLALVLLAPVGLLVQRAVHSVAVEREMRHRALAERVFDEMERALSRLLQQEEGRPFEEYAEAIAGALPPFVVGHFEVDPAGRARAVPSAGRLDAGSDAAATEEVVRTYLGRSREVGAPRADAPQLPGTTLDLHDGAVAERAVAAPPASDDSAYDAFRSLNKAVAERDQQRQVAETKRREKPASAASRGALGAAPAPAAEAMDEATPLATDLPPMVGRVVDARHLLLYRSVIRADRAYRQGIVLDVAKLGDWLRQNGLGSGGLGEYARASFTTRFDAPASPSPSDFSYRHRFAEPFDGLAARLDLRPLPGFGSVTYVYALSGVLVAAALFGLAALYRMVAVVVGYAERRSNFVAAVTHELKTPLTAIRMYGEMLRDGMVSSDAKRDEYYRHITAESERLSRLINNVLELSRLENGRRDVALTLGAVEPVVGEVAELLRPHVEGQGFALSVDVDPDLPPVRFERDALTQVLSNLIDNAVKYGGDGSSRRIELACRRADGGVAVGVRDHGAGVASRHLGRIFEPFYRGESELTRRSKGTGIGLALVRGLAERMGARVAGRNLAAGGFEIEVVFPAPRERG